MRRPVFSVLVCVILFTLLAGYGAAAGQGDPMFYVDTSAIDARQDLSDAQKSEVKNAMMDEIKRNLETAFGAGTVDVTNDGMAGGFCDRSVTVDPGIGTYKDKSNNTQHYWGQWTPPSSNVKVALGSYMDLYGGADFKTGDPPVWDTVKLGKAMGTTASHEIAHSYSAGHDDRLAVAGSVQEPNKMNSANSANQIGGGLPFNGAAKDTLSGNNGKPPCTAVTDYKSISCIGYWWRDPVAPVGQQPYEPLAVTALFGFTGWLADDFDFGWWGIDTDSGLFDGNSWADFVFKSSMTATPCDSPTITLFDGYAAHFVLRGRPGTPYAGLYYSVEANCLWVTDPKTRSDGSIVYRSAHAAWDIDNDDLADVEVNLNTCAYPSGNPPNGFRLGVAVPPRIAEAKLKVDGAYVSLMNVAVSRVFGDCFYAQQADRSSGIRVQMAPGIPVPAVVMKNQGYQIWGKIETVGDCERAVIVSDPSDIVFLESNIARPLGLRNAACGGSDYQYSAGLWPCGQHGVTSAKGLNNIGLLVRAWGRVTQIGEGYLYIDDGAMLDDGTYTGPERNIGVRVMCDPTGYGMGDYLVVTGISSCFRAPSGDIARRILTQSPEDVWKITEP